jgi:hypothetical protein
MFRMLCLLGNLPESNVYTYKILYFQISRPEAASRLRNCANRTQISAYFGLIQTDPQRPFRAAGIPFQIL